jgi:integrase/recombinase XerD
VNTQSKKVNRTKRVKVEFTQENQIKKELRYCSVVLLGNGRIRPDIVLVKGIEERHPEGAYHIEWRENGKHIRL